MKLSDLDYPLSKEKIALFPPTERTSAKLLCVDKKTGDVTHRVFSDIVDLLKPSDVLVLNNTRVLPARLFGKRATGGKVEALLLKEVSGNVWETLLKPGGRVKEGETIDFSGDGIELVAQVIEKPAPGSGQRFIKFSGEDIKGKIKKLGHVPLPPYIDRNDEALDKTMYQTVFAEKDGAVASPTAGLHFDEALLEKIRQKGIEVVYVTLHVSYGTFQPITVEHVEEHKMFEEEYEITPETSQKINVAKRSGRRVIVCGTTCVRALESAVQGTGSQLMPVPCVQSGKGKTSIFIYPPYDFKIVDGLITNFHMPKSTLLAMVSAFLGYEKLMAAYNTALKEDYRFASYGDAMFIQ
jgi:S-adenosylmethionine:tRNA ribosyltransferase-isomerase